MKSLLKTIVLGCLAFTLSSVQPASGVELKTKVDAGTLQKYTVKATCKGELKILTEKQVNTLPIQVNAELTFGERRVDDGSVPSELRSLRFYEIARSTVRLDKESILNRLPAERSLVRAKLTGNHLLLNAPKNPLTRDERDLLELAGDPLAMLGFLPNGDVKNDATWSIPEAALLTMFNLDEITETSVSGKLINTKGNIATISLAGKLAAKVHSSKTTINLTGSADFDTKTGTFTSWKLTVKENRSPNVVGPGFDITANVEATATATSEIAELMDSALGSIPLVDEQSPDRLMYAQRRGGYAMQYDSRWRIVIDEPQLISMRLIDDGAIIAQANFRLAHLPGSAPPMNRAEFELQVKNAIGKSFTKFQDSTEGQNPGGIRTLKVIAEGQADNVPVLWVSYLFEGPDGWRVNCTISLEDQYLSRFADADRAILETMIFPSEKNDKVEKTATATDSDKK
jgi:hypothetical protein